MKVNIFTTVMSVLISALVAYAFYAFSAEDVKVLLCVGSAVCTLCTLIPTMGIQLADTRTTVNMRILSVVSFLALLLSHVLCAVSVASINAYVLVNGGLLLLFVLLLYLISKT